MAATFDFPNLRIILDPAALNVTAQSIYSDWKNALQILDNRKHPPAFDTTGGANVTPDLVEGQYYKVRNDLGWRVRPPEQDGDYFVEGNLVPFDVTLPIGVPTLGNFTAFIIGLQNITQGVDNFEGTGSKIDDIHRAHFFRRFHNSGANTITIYEADKTTPWKVFDTNADLSDITPQ